MKHIQLVLIFLIAPLLLSNTIKHEYYVGVTNIEYVEEQKSLQIISQVFIDDFEKLLQERYDENITLSPDSDTKTVEAYMKRYIADKLKVNINGSAVKFKFLGKEYKDDITYCYLEVEGVKEVKSISVTNRILFDVFTEQQNIVRLKLFGKNKSFLLIPDNDKCMLNFD